MADRPLMKCGCSAMAIMKTENGDVPCCIVHDCTEINDKPLDLTGRKAKCAYYGGVKPRRRYANDECNYGCHGESTCGCLVDSSLDLSFFVYQGENSRFATQKCKNCGYYKSVHDSPYYANSDKKNPNLCINNGKEFEAIGDPGYDKFYCGCHGWD